MSPEQGAAGVTELAPTLVVKEQLSGDVEVFICCENSILTKVTGVEAPIFLLAAYYSFNIQYPKGLTSLFSLLALHLYNCVRLNQQKSRQLWIEH